MTEPSITCVIPVRDGAAHLRTALASVLGQTLPPAEVLVVDDASTDDSAAVAERFGDPVRVLRLPENVGPAAARGIGARAATGELVAFLDADDLWEPDRLALQSAHLELEGGIDVSFCEIENFWEAGQEAEEARWRAAGRERGTWMITAALARRSVLEQVPLPEDARHVDHLRWVLALREAGVPIAEFPRVLVHRRRHRRNLSREGLEEHFDELFDVLKASVDARRRQR